MRRQCGAERQSWERILVQLLWMVGCGPTTSPTGCVGPGLAQARVPLLMQPGVYRGCFSPNGGFSLRFVQDALRESYKYRSASCAALRGGSCFPSRGRRQRASRWVQAAVCAGGVGGSSSCTPLSGLGMGCSGGALLLCIRLDLALVFLESRVWGGRGRMLGRVRSVRGIQRE